MTDPDAEIDAPEDEDPTVPRDVWRRIVGNLFSRLSEDHPEKYDLARIERENPSLYQQIIEKSRALEALGDARQSEVEAAYEQVLGLFDQAYWLRRGYALEDFALDEHGAVLGVLISDRVAKGMLELLLGCWATARDDFSSPDGRPVLKFEEIEGLSEKPAEEIEELVQSKRQ